MVPRRPDESRPFSLYKVVLGGGWGRRIDRLVLIRLMHETEARWDRRDGQRQHGSSRERLAVLC